MWVSKDLDFTILSDPKIITSGFEEVYDILVATEMYLEKDSIQTNQICTQKGKINLQRFQLTQSLIATKRQCRRNGNSRRF